MTAPLAVVTGASAGIGRELAREFARHGYDLVLCAENTALDDVAERLRAEGARVWTVRADLATAAGVSELVEGIETVAKPIDVLALNAGVGIGGPFAVGTETENQLRVVQLNVTGTVHLAKRLMPGMVQRGSGRVLITSSTAARMPGPFQATYNASKSFLHSFAVAVGTELRGTGVTVTTLLPGPTDTEFFARAGMTDTKIGATEWKDDPARVAQEAYAALSAGRTHVVTGSLLNTLLFITARILPDRLLTLAHSVFSAPGSASRSTRSAESAQPARSAGSTEATRATESTGSAQPQ